MKGFFMSIFKSIIALTVLAAFFGCGDEYMLKVENKPEIHLDQSKATIVIFRSTSLGGPKEIYNYIDSKYIGTTKGKSFFITTAEPGTHYIVADAENKACAKITLEANKVYYLNQQIYMGVMSARTGFSGSNPEEFEKEKSEMDFFVVNSNQAPPSVDAKDLEKAIADFNEENGKDPERFKDTNGLQGF